MTRARTAIALATCLTASIASAQEPRPIVTLRPASAPRWEASAHVTWLGERRPDPSIQWDQWFNVASGGGMVGYYWTSHLKAELDISTSTEGERYTVEPIALPPGNTTVLPLQRDHEFRVTTASAGLVGQFFDNAWFHPFVGAGLELVREREHIITSLPFGLPRDPRAPAIQDFQPETLERFRARPYAATGFKAYVSERAFIRTDLRTSWSSDGLAALAWRTGVGFDF